MMDTSAEVAEIVEVPGLRTAYADRAAADVSERNSRGWQQEAEAAVALRERDRAAILSRARSGERVAGAELVKADHALAEAGASLTLATTAFEAAKAAEARARAAETAAERPVWAAELVLMETEMDTLGERFRSDPSRAGWTAHQREQLSDQLFHARLGRFPAPIQAKVRAILDAHR